ncbi:MAG TPA: hypothetical protein VKF62_10635, partial [Planctomycetota bacterium]|nr:hypothetical protein [Planctomycetota bacterium]
PIAGPGRSLVLTSPVRELQSVVLTFAGPPGDLLVLLFSPAYIPLFLPSCSGTLLPASPLAIFQGAVPASGVLTVTVPVPELGVGFEGAILFTQANFITPAGFCNVSSGSAVVLLDQAF